jgi:hypothetical protein
LILNVRITSCRIEEVVTKSKEEVEANHIYTPVSKPPYRWEFRVYSAKLSRYWAVLNTVPAMDRTF